jgi:hypothetical protein
VSATRDGSTATPVSIPSILTLAFTLSDARRPEEGDGIPELAIKVAKSVVWIHGRRGAVQVSPRKAGGSRVRVLYRRDAGRA